MPPSLGMSSIICCRSITRTGISPRTPMPSRLAPAAALCSNTAPRKVRWYFQGTSGHRSLAISKSPKKVFGRGLADPFSLNKKIGLPTIGIATRTPAHFPEVGLEHGGCLEDHNQLGFAGGGRIKIGKTLQLRPRLGSNLLVRRAGVFFDPNAIWVRCGESTGTSSEPGRDFRVANHARGKGYLQGEQIATHSCVE